MGGGSGMMGGGNSGGLSSLMGMVSVFTALSSASLSREFEHSYRKADILLVLRPASSCRSQAIEAMPGKSVGQRK